MKRIIYLLFCALLFIAGNTIAQTYPAYMANVVDTSSSGYYFIVPIIIGGGPGNNPTQMILDRNGDVVYCKEFTMGNTGDFKLQKNGLLSYSYLNKFYLLDSTFTPVDSVACKNGIMNDGHEMQLLPNGHFLLLGFENITMNLSAYHLFNNNGSPGSSTATVKCGVIQEQDANKNVVFEWHANNHYSFLDVDTDRLFNPANVDWNHMNALELDTDGNILVSVRHFNEITKINRSTGAIMWRMGGNANQFTFTNDSLMFKGQHDIRRLANGNITMLDNGLNSVPIHPAAAKEYSIDENNHIATLVWSKTNSANFYSKAIGNVQRNSNGNTLVNYGMVDNFNTALEVVKPNGTKVFELSFLDSMKSYRVYNYNYIPWDLQRPVINCTLVNNQFYLDAGNGYNSYKWSNGATTQTILATSLGAYSVFVPKGNGGFIRSETFVVNNLSDPCGTLSSSENVNQNTSISIFPNPVVDKIHINGLQPISHYEVRNLQDVVIWEGTDIEQQNFSFLSSGFYFLEFTSNTKQQILKFIKR